MEKSRIDLLTAKLYETRLDPAKEIKEPPVLLSIVQRSGTQSDYKPLFSLGDLSLLQGRQKSKKTYFTSVICANLINEFCYMNKLSSKMPKNKTIAIFDTEQSDYYAQKTNQRIAKSSGSDNFYYFAMRNSEPLERKDAIERFLDMELGKIGFILIDGIVDLLYDFNDLKECRDLVQWIMMITKKYHVHCTCILHENISDGKARGHIGTMLAQKAETVLRIEKDANNHNRSKITGVDTRGVGFTPFDIEIDFTGEPHLVESLEHIKVI